MSNMPNVPKDVKHAAEKIAGEYLRFDISCQRLYADIVQALMAERARCARIATEWHPDDVRPQDLYSWSMTANEIARAIRGSDV